MPLDALCLSGLVHELNGALSGARIDKIYQPGRDEVVLALRAPGGNVKLLLSARTTPAPHVSPHPAGTRPDRPPYLVVLVRRSTPTTDVLVGSGPGPGTVPPSVRNRFPSVPVPRTRPGTGSGTGVGVRVRYRSGTRDGPGRFGTGTGGVRVRG